MPGWLEGDVLVADVGALRKRGIMANMPNLDMALATNRSNTPSSLLAPGATKKPLPREGVGDNRHYGLWREILRRSHLHQRLGHVQEDRFEHNRQVERQPRTNLTFLHSRVTRHRSRSHSVVKIARDAVVNRYNTQVNLPGRSLHDQLQASSRSSGARSCGQSRCRSGGMHPTCRQPGHCMAHHPIDDFMRGAITATATTVSNHRPSPGQPG